MRFEVLGEVRVIGDDAAVVPVDGPARRRIMAMLLAADGDVVPVDALVDAIWTGRPPPSFLPSLRSQIARLRRIVGDRLIGTPAGYALRLRSTDSFDVREMEAVVDQARAAMIAGTADRTIVGAQLADVLDRWCGRPFGEMHDLPGVRLEAIRLEVLRPEVVELCARLQLAAGQPTAAVVAAEQLVAEHELRESAWELLVSGLARSGRPAEGVRAARRAAEALAEAGLVPGAALRAAEDEALGLTTATTDISPPHVEAEAEPSQPVAGARQPPAPRTATIGRSREHATITDRLATGRLVTLVGPGGVGKTRLAIDVARELADRFRRGAVVVDLAAIKVSDEVGGVVAAALDLRADRATTDEVLGRAGDLDQLVVLDNCEHLLDEVARIVPFLLGSGDRLSVLATSREPIDVEGETVVPIEPLASDARDAAGVELFVERARMVAPDVALADDQVVRIVQRLDGLPLAIEMAAARLRGMTPDDVERALSTNLVSLSSTRRDVDPRQRTVQDLLEWSEDLLEPAVRDIWLELAAFAGPVAADDVAAVTGVPGTGEALARLVNRSLVVLAPGEGRSRYSLLQLVRDFGRERLRQEGRLDEVEHRHARWVLDVVADVDRRLRGPDEPSAARRFHEVFDELRRAVGWALLADPPLATQLLASASLACRQAQRPELADWSIRVLAALSPTDPEVSTAQAVAAAGLTIVGRLDDARAFGEESLRCAPSGRSALDAMDALGDVAIYQGRLDDAASWYLANAEQAASRGDATYAAIGRAGAAVAMAYQGRTDEALELLRNVTSESISGTGWLDYARGELLLERHPERALEHLGRAVEAARSAENRYLLGVAMLSESSVVARSADPALGAARFVDLLDRYRDAGEPKHLLTALRNVVPLLVRLGNHRAAATLHAAVVDHQLVPSFGPEADRLEEAATLCRGALGAAQFDHAADAGRPLGLDDALHVALEALTSGSETVGVAQTLVEPQLAGLFERRGELWHIEFRGGRCVVADLKGIRDIVTLVRRPAVEVHALELVGSGDTSAGSGPLADDTARDAYRRRIVELQREIDLARERQDPRRAERAENELDLLVEELSATFGLGGRARTAHSGYERARSTVTNRIRVAIRKIDAVLPDLGRHLANSVQTGTWCVYRPETETAWTVVHDG